MRVRVYYNIHKHVWSVQEHIPGRGWRVRHHALALVLEGVTFKVSEAGRQRVIREKRKNVHAYAIGQLVTLDTFEYDQERISYNPYKGASFTLGGTPIESADCVVFTAQNQLFSLTPAKAVVYY